MYGMYGRFTGDEAGIRAAYEKMGIDRSGAHKFLANLPQSHGFREQDVPHSDNADAMTFQLAKVPPASLTKMLKQQPLTLRYIGASYGDLFPTRLMNSLRSSTERFENGHPPFANWVVKDVPKLTSDDIRDIGLVRSLGAQSVGMVLLFKHLLETPNAMSAEFLRHRQVVKGVDDQVRDVLDRTRLGTHFTEAGRQLMGDVARLCYEKPDTMPYLVGFLRASYDDNVRVSKRDMDKRVGKALENASVGANFSAAGRHILGSVAKLLCEQPSSLPHVAAYVRGKLDQAPGTP